MKNIKIDALSSFFLVTICISMLMFQNGIYLFLPICTIYLILFLNQHPNKPSVFSLIAIQHFLQISAGVWLCNFLDKDIDYDTQNRSTAIVASCFGLLFLLAPIIQYQSKVPDQTKLSLFKTIKNFSVTKVMYLYVGAFFLTSFLGSIAFLFGGLTQMIFSFVKIKWVLFILLGYLCYLKKEKLSLFYLFIFLEFANGFLGFFSDF